MKQVKNTFKNVKYVETLALYAGLFLFFAPSLVPVSTSLPKQFAVSLNVTICFLHTQMNRWNPVG